MANKTWLGNDSGNEGKWTTAANWSPAAVPVTGDTVIFDGNAAYNCDALISGTSEAATISNADPAVVTTATTDFASLSCCKFTTTGALPTGVVAGTLYYMNRTGAKTYNLYDTLANATGGGATGRVATSDAGSGTHTIQVLTATTLTILIYDSFQDYDIGSATGCLCVAADVVEIGKESGLSTAQISDKIWIDNWSTATTATIHKTSTGSTDNYPPVRLLGPGLTINMRGGKVGIANDPDETATITAAHLMSGSKADLSIGRGSTLTQAIINDGTLTSDSSNTAPDIQVYGGEYYNTGSGAHSSIKSFGGKVYYYGTGNIAKFEGTHLDMSGNAVTKTIGSGGGNYCKVYSGFDINLDNGNPGSIVPEIQFINCNPSDGTLRLPANLKATIATI